MAKKTKIDLPGESLGEARKTLDKIGFWHQDTTVEEAKAEVRLTDGGVVNVDRRSKERPVMYPVADHPGFKKYFGIDPGVLKQFKDDPHLQSQMLDYHLQRNLTNPVRICGNAEKVIAFQDPDRVYISPLGVFDIIAAEIDKGAKAEILQGNSRELVIRFVSAWSGNPPKKPGDVLHAGVMLKMDGKVLLGPYSHQMVCSNGLMKNYHKLQGVGEESEDDCLERIRNVAATAFAEAMTLVTSIIKLDELRILDMEPQLVRLGRQFQIPNDLMGKTVNRLPELPKKPTMFDMISLISRVIRDRKTGREGEQIRLGTAVHALASHGRCTTCGTVLCNHE